MAGEACMVGGMYGRGACMAGEVATVVDGTHPTGMHNLHLGRILIITTWSLSFI